MKISQLKLKQLIKHIIRESIQDVNPEFADGTVRPMPATSVAEDNEVYMKGKFVDRGEIKLEGGLDPKLANYIANNHWDVMGELGKDERGVFNYKTRGDRWCCSVGMLNGKPAMLNVTTTPGRLQLLVGKELSNNSDKQLDEPINEMSSTGAAAGYSTPFAFTKNKKGSPKGIEAAKKYGTVVGEAPRV